MQPRETARIVALSSTSMLEGVVNWLQSSVPSLVEGSKVRRVISREHTSKMSATALNRLLRCRDAIFMIASAKIMFKEVSNSAPSGEQCVDFMPGSQEEVTVASIPVFSVTLMDTTSVENIFSPDFPNPCASIVM